MVRCGKHFIPEEVRRAGGSLKANTALIIDGVPNEILKEVIVLYPETLLVALAPVFGREDSFPNGIRQRLVLLRKGKKLLEDASSFRPICLLDTIGKLLEEMIL